MKKLFFLFICFLFILICPSAVKSVYLEEKQETEIKYQSLWSQEKINHPLVNFSDEEFIVKFKNTLRTTGVINSRSTGISSIDELNQKFNVLSIEKVFKTKNNEAGNIEITGMTENNHDLSNIYKFRIAKGADILSIIKEYKKNPSVEYAEPNYIYHTFVTPNDPSFSSQWALNQSSNHDIDAPEAWDIQRGNRSIIIAIVDTGVDWDHPDLAKNIWNNTKEIPNNGIDDDGNGYIDDVIGWDFTDTYDPYCTDVDCKARDNNPMDYNGHGTHCSGIAAAVTNNNIGIAGTCWNCTIMPLRAGYDCYNGYGCLDIDDIAAAIIYAADDGANVISMSFGGDSYSLMQDAINYAYSKGVVLVSSAGNDNSNFKNYPAAYDNVISVAATDSNDALASFSNYGSWVDIAAPGVNIYSTLYNDTYASMSGTSMSTPFVAGLAGLILSKNSSFTSEEVRSIILSSTDNVSSDKYIGIGRINAYKALKINSITLARLNSSLDDAIVSGIIKIYGTANGTSFTNYSVYYSHGLYPTSWTKIVDSTTPITNGLMNEWDTSLANDGINTIRLVVNNLEGFISEDRVVLTTHNAYISLPEENDILGKNVIINGSTNVTNFQSYKLEYKNASDSSSWILINKSNTPIFNGILAIWNTSTLKTGDYKIKLTVNHTDEYINEYNVTIHIDETLKEGWPVSTYYLSAFAPPIVDDINNDGNKEILYAAGYSPLYPNGVLYAFSYNGTPLDGWPAYFQGIPEVGFSIGDINNDGNKEIIVSSSVSWLETNKEFGGIYVFDKNANLLWKKKIGTDWYYYQSTITDINNDNNNEIIIQSWPSLNVSALDKNGNIVWSTTIYGSISGGVNMRQQSPSIGDFDGDGKKEIGFVTNQGSNTSIYILNSSGAIVFNYNFTEESDIGYLTSPFVAVEFDNDGKEELAIIIDSYNKSGSVPTSEKYKSKYYLLNFSYNYHLNFMYNLIDEESGNSIFEVHSIAVFDTNYDGKLELSISGTVRWGSGCWERGIAILNNSGIVLLKNLGCNGNEIGRVVVADIDNDYCPDILFESPGNENDIYTINCHGNALSDFPKKTKIWGWGKDLAIGDIDNDEKLEIVFFEQYKIYVWSLNESCSQHCQGQLFWPMFFHDSHHTGHYINPKLLPIATTFNGNTTEFMYVNNLSKVYNATLERIKYGKIEFGNQPVNFTSANLDEYVNISHNFISINKTELPDLNKPTILTLYGLTFINPKILKDGEDCPISTCKIISYSNGILVFNVTQFSNYSATEGATLEPPKWSYFYRNPPEPTIVTTLDDVTINVTWSDNENLDKVIIWENSTGNWLSHDFGG